VGLTDAEVKESIIGAGKNRKEVIEV